MRKGSGLFLLVAVLLSTTEVEARASSSADFAALPKYCYARMRGSEAEKQVWKSRFGHGSYIHLHHYCHGLDNLNKANRSADRKVRELMLTKAIKQFNYIGKHAPQSFVLMPENYYNRGKAMKRLKDISGALESFYKSIQLNKRYTRSYAAISDIYADSGNKADALKIIQQGLKVVPKSKALNRRLKELK